MSGMLQGSCDMWRLYPVFICFHLFSSVFRPVFRCSCCTFHVVPPPGFGSEETARFMSSRHGIQDCPGPHIGTHVPRQVLTPPDAEKPTVWDWKNHKKSDVLCLKLRKQYRTVSHKLQAELRSSTHLIPFGTQFKLTVQSYAREKSGYMLDMQRGCQPAFPDFQAMPLPW